MRDFRPQLWCLGQFDPQGASLPDGATKLPGSFPLFLAFVASGDPALVTIAKSVKATGTIMRASRSSNGVLSALRDAWERSRLCPKNHDLGHNETCVVAEKVGIRAATG